MQRRDFLKAGLAMGAVAAAGTPSLVSAASRFPAAASDTLRLNSNENPLGLSTAARRAIVDGLSEANRYPRDSRVRLAAALAERHGVEPENIVLGNGSTEVLQMSVQALASPGARLILADPTFEDVPWYAVPFPYELVKVALDERFAHDLGRMRQAAEGSDGPALVYICNPNNPTGTLTPSAEVDAWIDTAPETTRFLIDEAYFEYCEDEAYWSCVGKIERPNVIVARSFSKIYGMAGIRLGYGVAHEDTAERLRQYIGKNNANQLVLVAALAALGDEKLIARSRAANAEGMRILREALDELGLEHLPSHTNFVMHRIRGDLERYRERMLARGVHVGRPFPPMLEHNRLSIGLPEEMSRFTEILRDFRSSGWI